MNEVKQPAAIQNPPLLQLGQLCEGFIEVVFGAGIKDMKLQPEVAGRALHICKLNILRIIGVDHVPNELCLGDQLVQQFQALRRYLNVQLGHARDVAAWPIQSGDQAELYRVTAYFEDDWNGSSCRLRNNCRWGSGRDNHCHLTEN